MAAGYGLMPTKTITKVQTRVETRVEVSVSPSPYASPVYVPSPVPTVVYVTVEQEAEPLSALEAQAHCRGLARQAIGSAQPSGDDLLDQLGAAYAVAAEERLFRECMGEQGF